MRMIDNVVAGIVRILKNFYLIVSDKKDFRSHAFILSDKMRIVKDIKSEKSLQIRLSFPVRVFFTRLATFANKIVL